jgi:tetratricopeptide (TPR) repeat protein
MRIHSRFLQAGLLLGLWFGALPRAASAAPSIAGAAEERLDRVLLFEALRAAGKEPASWAAYEASLRKLIGEIDRSLGSPSPYRTARRIHKILHQSFLRRYEAAADGLDAVLDRGEYNCLSSSLLYGIVARAFGLEPQVVEVPRHVYVRLKLGPRVVDVETTSRIGFDFHQRPDPEDARLAGLEYGGSGAPGSPAAAAAAAALSGLAEDHVVDLERAVAFIWHNTGRRALEGGQPLRAAIHFREEAQLQPELASRSEVLTALLARAFRTEYEAGRFESAYRIAEIDLEIFPAQTSGRDRLQAAALKRIRAASESGDVAEAERILDAASAAVSSPPDAARMERGACPLIAAAAVQVGDWGGAERMTERFAKAQPDRAEAQRLKRWVAAREREAAEQEEAAGCSEAASVPAFLVPYGFFLAGDPPGSPGTADGPAESPAAGFPAAPSSSPSAPPSARD